jgi:hypothetical protein
MLGRWLSQSLNLIFALVFALLAMQAPAITHEYLATVSQVADAARSDIEQRKASARQFYGIQAEDDDQFVGALRIFEPSNADTLALELEKERALRSAYDGITARQPLLQPIMAAADAVSDPKGYKRTVWRGLIQSYDPQINFSVAAAIYGIVGLLVGTFLAQLLISLLGVFRPRRARPEPG